MLGLSNEPLGELGRLPLGGGRPLVSQCIRTTAGPTRGIWTDRNAGRPGGDRGAVHRAPEGGGRSFGGSCVTGDNVQGLRPPKQVISLTSLTNYKPNKPNKDTHAEF